VGKKTSRLSDARTHLKRKLSKEKTDVKEGGEGPAGFPGKKEEKGGGDSSSLLCKKKKKGIRDRKEKKERG